MRLGPLAVMDVVAILSLVVDEHWEERVPGTVQLNLAAIKHNNNNNNDRVPNYA